MKTVILPGMRSGEVVIPSSKSQAHRMLICAALGSAPVTLRCRGLSRDLQATMDCLRALGAGVVGTRQDTWDIQPIAAAQTPLCALFCQESGSTLRFLLPLVGALGKEAVFHMAGRLPQRPLEPLRSVLASHGMRLWREDTRLHCGGQLEAGIYTLPGDVSSQFISGLLMALPLLAKDSVLEVTGDLESGAYVSMTEQVLQMGGIRFEKHGLRYEIPGRQRPQLPEVCQVEGDYSSAAFFLCAGALSKEGICVSGLSSQSLQADRAILPTLREFGAQVEERQEAVFVRRAALRGCRIDAAQIPDLVPVLSVLAAAAQGRSEIVHAARLRLKESDRLQSTAAMLRALGAQVQERRDGLQIEGGALRGGVVDSWKDHRIAMAAAVAACACSAPVEILDSACVEKSYPQFFEDFAKLKEEGV